MLEFLLDPFIDTYFFGCPDSCIVPNSDTHQVLKILFTPLVVLVVGIGAIIGTLLASGRMPNLESLRSLRSKSQSPETKEPEQIPEPKKIYKTEKQFEKAVRKEQRRDFLSKVDEMDRNPDIAFNKFLASQVSHPQTESLKAVRTEAKEPEMTKEPEMSSEKEQEFYKDNKESLEKQAKEVAELMKSENITEDEAIDRIIQEMPQEVEVEVEGKKVPQEVEVEVEGKKDEINMEENVFEQDIKEKEYPKHLKFFHNQFKKKEKPKYKFNLTKLGSQRRDQYADQIENKLQEWVFPMPTYAGKNQEYQINDDLIKSELKKLSLFISMCEMVVDKRTKKKTYWEKIRIG
jgi:hypothetical protein